MNPFMRFADADAALVWLQQAFGFEERAVHRRDDGSIAHAELSLGGSVLMLGPGDPVAQGVYLGVGDDVRAHHDRAARAGVEIVRPPTTKPDGRVDYSARDLAGHLWEFGSYRPAAAGAPQAVYPFVRYADADAAIAQLGQAFDFRPREVTRGEDGRVVHAELGYAGELMMLGEGDPTRRGTYAAVDDTDAHYARARAAGAEIVREPEDMPYDSREYSALDPGGHVWSFGTYRPVA